MVSAQPHFLLFSGVEASRNLGGRWHFLLESLDGQQIVEAEDREPGISAERLELLAVVRGLEALDQPSRVTLVTASRHVSHGLRYGLDEWRCNHWCWERDGRWVPIKHRDLWQRIDRTLKYHQVDCRRWRFDGAGSHVPTADAPSEKTGSLLRRWANQGWAIVERGWHTAARVSRLWDGGADLASA